MAGSTFHTGQAGPIAPRIPASPERLEVKAYRMLTRLARPAAPFILRMRERRGKEDPARRGERLGRASIPRPDGPLAWVHAASVGETSAILPLVSRLEQIKPGLTVLLTTGTVTSANFAAGRLTGPTLHQYVPLDEPSFVAAFLDHWRPSLAIFTEQEVWPNLVLTTAARGVPLALVNARMSERSFERWARRPGLASALFSKFEVVLAQNAALAHRFERIGATRTLVAGNLKIDAPAPPIDPEAFEVLDAAIARRPLFLAASTHDNEEAAVAQAHCRVKRSIPGLLTMIAPRHPDRGAAIARDITEKGLIVRRRALGQLPKADTDVYVADTIGELGTFYATAPIAFIGGSLIEHGGQNPIEAVRHGAVVVTGPSTYNFADAYGALLEADGAVAIEDARMLPEVIGGLIGSGERLAEMRANAERALQTLSGALDRTVTALLPLLPEAG